MNKPILYMYKYFVLWYIKFKVVNIICPKSLISGIQKSLASNIYLLNNGRNTNINS